MKTFVFLVYARTNQQTLDILEECIKYITNKVNNKDPRRM